MTKEKIHQEALSRAINGISLTNYPAIYEGFIEKGIPEEEIHPRVNVYGFTAWLALGRCVRKGEHGVKIPTYRQIEDEDKDGKAMYRSIPSMTTVFHISQTEEVNDQTGKT